MKAITVLLVTLTILPVFPVFPASSKFQVFTLAEATSSAEDYLNQGVAFYDQNEFGKAVEAFTQAIKLNPNYADAYRNRGNAYNDLNQNDKAVEDISQAIILNPKDDYAYFLRGYVFNELKQYDKAIEDYTQAIKLDPNYTGAYYSRGKAYDNIKLYDKAIEDYTQAIKLNAKHAKAYFWRGYAYRFLGKKTEAIADFNIAEELDPTLIPPDDMVSTAESNKKFKFGEFFLSLPSDWITEENNNEYFIAPKNFNEQQPVVMVSYVKSINSFANNSPTQVLSNFIKRTQGGQAIAQHGEIPEGKKLNRNNIYSYFVIENEQTDLRTRRSIVKTWFYIYDSNNEKIYVFECVSPSASFKQNIESFFNIVQTFQFVSAQPIPKPVSPEELFMNYVGACASQTSGIGICAEYWPGENDGNLKEKIKIFGEKVILSRGVLSEIKKINPQNIENYIITIHNGYVNHYMALRNKYSEKFGSESLINYLKSIRQFGMPLI